jgi:type IV pilus assembly protein PilB
MAQRLVRVNCIKCKQPYVPEPDLIRAAGVSVESLAKATPMKGTGCNHCRQSGYRGRNAIFELMKMTGALRELTFAQAPAQELRRQARKGGMKTLLQDGIMKALKGVTTLDEVLSTCHAEILEGAN